MLNLGITCLCDCGDQGVIEAEQPALMQGAEEVIDLIPDPQCRHLGIWICSGALPEPSQTVPETLGGRWERLGGVRRLSGRLHGAPGKHWEGRRSAGSTKLIV